MQNRNDRGNLSRIAAGAFILFAILFQLSFAETFRIDVEIYPSTREDTVRLAFGAIEGATDEYDVGIDEIMPPPPPGRTYAYFWIDDSLIAQYSVDLRSANAESLRYRFAATNGIPYYTICWNHYAFPADGEFLIGAERTDTALVDDWFDMRTTDSLAFLVWGEIRYIAHSSVSETVKPERLYITAYPNPASDFFNIDGEVPRRVGADRPLPPAGTEIARGKIEDGSATPVLSVEIYDIGGHLISRTEGIPLPIRYNTATLKNGVYFVKITTEDRMGSIPILIVQ